MLWLKLNLSTLVDGLTGRHIWKKVLPPSTIRTINFGRQVDRSTEVKREEQGSMGRQIPKKMIFHLCQPLFQIKSKKEVL